MHKKLEAELVSLAHSILELKNNDVAILHKKAHAIYEKLTVLKFVEENLNTTANFDEVETPPPPVAQEIIQESAKVEALESIIEATKEVEENVVVTQEKTVEVFIDEAPIAKDTIKKNTLEEEFKDAISADVATNLFEKATKESPIIEENKLQSIRSINDTLFKSNLQIGLNDRIAFVKHLFEGSQEDFNRVLSQLNSFKTEKEAKDFMFNLVKPDYNWSDKEEYEQRLVDLIERKFL